MVNSKNYDSYSNLWFTEEEGHNLKLDYRIKNIIFDDYSSFQHIVVADSYDFGKMLILDDAIQTTTADGFIYNEMISHVPICSHPNPEKVLIIGGGDCGAVREIAKYPSIKKIDMVEIDEMVVMVSKEYLKEIAGDKIDKRINFIFADGVNYAKECKEQYDIIIVDSSDPVGPAVELFSQNFYENISKILKNDGIFACQSESPVFYSEIMKKIFKTLQDVYNDVKLYTATVPTYPGGLWSFAAASKTNIITDSKKLIGNTRYINESILKSCFCLPEFVVKMLK
ncbi:MAG: polyamine aminopropyltransferase [Clostridiales bacterium]|nr:polyamine aminopropyltransferase [Clostridiales bacterium]